MIQFSDARAHVVAGVSPLGVIHAKLDDSLGLVLAEDLISAERVPPFANSAMDGFAVRSMDTRAGVALTVVETIPAGYAPKVTVGEGQASRIMTGAPMPVGADAVVMVEKTRVDGDRVTIDEAVAPGMAVRSAGDDLAVGDLALSVGSIMTPAAVGLAATIGRMTVPVVRRVKVGVLSTGDELVDGDVQLAPGQIRDSNRRALVSLLRQAGCTAIDLGRVADDEAAIESALRDGVTSCDALVTSGGVSMGDFDFVKSVLDRIGDMRWMQIAIKPAKPLAFGTIESMGRRVPVFGLPGNPVSSQVSFELFARPALRKMMGHAQLDRRRIAATSTDGIERRPDGKIHFDRAVLDIDESGFTVRSAGGQGSHHSAAMAAANALAVVPDGDGIVAGGRVEVIPLGLATFGGDS